LEEINRALFSLYNSKAYHNLADVIAERFVTLGNTIDSKTWREAARGGSQGNEIYELLYKNISGNVENAIHQKVIENAQLIKTLPLKISEDITTFVQSETFKGTRSSEIAKILKLRVSDYSKAKADTIARTESSKAMTALTEARAKDVGVNWYTWRTADDGRVRNSHAHMEGVLCRWDDPPAPEELIGKKSVGKYNAGNIYNCRCYPSPLVTLSRTVWPAKVHISGKIITMSKAEFEKIAA
jgi:SPP1 gp7 family putative phage head morphogenesis protein